MGKKNKGNDLELTKAYIGGVSDVLKHFSYLFMKNKERMTKEVLDLLPSLFLLLSEASSSLAEEIDESGIFCVSDFVEMAEAILFKSVDIEECAFVYSHRKVAEDQRDIDEDTIEVDELDELTTMPEVDA